MSSGYSSVKGGFRMDATPLIIGASLVGVGAMLAMAGALIGGRALVAATRRWMRELEVPPSDVARHKWDQTRAAATASARAWHGHNGAHAGRARS